MSSIMHFKSEERRGSFLALIQKQRPDIVPRIKVVFSEPAIIARTTSAEQDVWLSNAVSGYGHYQPDQQLNFF